jgi:hypothetical protein
VRGGDGGDVELPTALNLESMTIRILELSDRVMATCDLEGAARSLIQ